MKFVISKFSNDTKVFTDDGKDITDEMGIYRINVTVQAGEFTKVLIECHPPLVKISDVEPESKFVTYEMLMGGSVLELKPPEAILDEFKVKPISSKED